MIHPRHILPLLAAVILAAPSARGDDLLAEKPTQKSGISIQLPKNWQLDDHPAARTLLLARAPTNDKDDTGQFQTLLVVSSEPGSKIDGQAQQARVAKNFANYKPTEDPQNITINGLEGVKFGGTLTLGPLKIRTRQYVLLHDNHIYTITFMTLDSLWSTYAPAIEASAATFTVVAK